MGPSTNCRRTSSKGEELREAIIAADPTAKDNIDRLGNFIDGEGRYLIHPYMLYTKESDLMRIHARPMSRQKRPNYYRCFVVDNDGQIDPHPSPRGPTTKHLK